MKYIIGIVLFLALIVSFYSAYHSNISESYYLAMVSLVAFVAHCWVVVLNYKLGGQYISLQKRMSGVEKEQLHQQELAKSIASAFSILYEEGQVRSLGLRQREAELRGHLGRIEELLKGQA